MSIAPAAPLPPAPTDAIAPDGTPRWGAYQGGFARVDVAPIAGGFLRRVTRRKRWIWGCVSTPEVLLSFAIVDVGYAANAFFAAVDMASGRALCDRSWLGVGGLSASVSDHPGEGAEARFSAPGVKAAIVRATGSAAFSVELTAGDLRLRCVLDAASAPPPLAIVMPVGAAGSGRLDCTQKTVLLAASGTFELAGRRVVL